MNPCPHCMKSNQGFVVKGQMVGSVESFYDEEGCYYELNMDRAYWKNFSKTVRCANCGKIRKDVYIYDRTEIKEYNTKENKYEKK